MIIIFKADDFDIFKRKTFNTTWWLFFATEFYLDSAVALSALFGFVAVNGVF